jgi:hypothetical protein
MVEPREVSGSQRSSGNLMPDRVQIKLIVTIIYIVAYLSRGRFIRPNRTWGIDAGTPMRPDNLLRTRVRSQARPQRRDRSYRSLRDGSSRRISQAMNCLATIIQSLRDLTSIRLAADKRPVLNRSLSETPARSGWGSCSPARVRSR